MIKIRVAHSNPYIADVIYELESIDELNDKLENDFAYALKEAYDEMLDDMETTTICGHNYSTAYALEQVDPIMYREGYCDYISSEMCEIEYYLFEENVAYNLGDLEISIEGEGDE